MDDTARGEEAPGLRATGFAAGARAAAPLLPARAIGEAVVGAERRSGATRLSQLRQAGSAKAFLPGAGRAGAGPLDAIFLNTAGGVTGGDRFRYRAAAGPGAWLRCASQAAEKAYQARPGEVGEIAISLEAAAGATLQWLAQETILFERSALRRRITATLAEDARFLAVEPLVFGRTAMGERLNRVKFQDQWHLWRGGALVYADALRIGGDMPKIQAAPALFGGAGAMASLLYVGPDAEARLAPLRDLLPPSAGASLVRGGVLVMRMLAEDGFALRRSLIPALELMGGAPLPKVWTI